MKYLNFVCGDDLPTQEQIAVMHRDFPGWFEQVEGIRLLGRPLDIPETATTVRVRGGETLVTDGPFVEAKEFIAGLDLFDCAHLDDAIQAAVTSPVTQVMAMEIRTFAGEPLVGERAAAFGRCEDGDTEPYALIVWAGGAAAVPSLNEAEARETEAWRQDLAARGLHILGGTLENADTATTVRVRDGQPLIVDGPFLPAAEFIAAFDVLSCAGREQAIEFAAAHPARRDHAIEVRPFEG
jgi:hypothetical protein